MNLHNVRSDNDFKLALPELPFLLDPNSYIELDSIQQSRSFHDNVYRWTTNSSFCKSVLKIMFSHRPFSALCVITDQPLPCLAKWPPMSLISVKAFFAPHIAIKVNQYMYNVFEGMQCIVCLESVHNSMQ